MRAPYFYPARDGGNHQQTRTSKYRRLPAVRAPYFYPARDGGNHQQTRTNKYRRYASVMSPVFIPRPGRRQTPEPEKRHRSEDTGKRNAENAQRQQTRPGLQHRGPRRAVLTEQGQSSGAEGPAKATRREAEEENNPRVLNATGVEEQPVYDTHQDCATHGKASEHFGTHTSINAHPDCAEATVHKPHGVTVLAGEPACDTHRERKQEIGKLQKAGALPDEGCRCLANQ